MVGLLGSTDLLILIGYTKDNSITRITKLTAYLGGTNIYTIIDNQLARLKLLLSLSGIY
jgi:hypothetical protein